MRLPERGTEQRWEATRALRRYTDGRRRPHVTTDARTLQPRAHGRQALGAGKTRKRSDGWAFGNESPRVEEGELKLYVTIHVTTTPSNSSLCLYLREMNGGRDRTRTCDLLRVKQAL